jgi:hypothetical protein
MILFVAISCTQTPTKNVTQKKKEYFTECLDSNPAVCRDLGLYLWDKGRPESAREHLKYSCATGDKKGCEHLKRLFPD